MSEVIEMAEYFPSINPFTRKSVIQEELDFGQGDSYSLGEDLEKGTRVESDDVAGNPSSLGMVDEPPIQPGASFEEDDGELQGNLVAPGTPLLSGGYADIFRGIWRSPDGTLTEVAVKTLKPIRPTSMSFLPNAIALQQRREKSLKREADVWARLRHPNVQPFLGFRTQPKPCLVSEWCENGDLVKYLNNNPDLSRPEKLEPLVQVARGLAFLHSQSPPICHGDIKPENVLMNGFCEAALSDFGLSRVIQESDASTGLTTGYEAKGSHRYMAPELLLEPNAKPSLESDVYAFGGLMLAVCLYNMACAADLRFGNL
ncbi:hypothetical protein FRC04_004055 [Tulasnella sp. 424]|nr:hypothetical protein FRC04_004055 [Tulasnella sp. 424]